MAAIAAFSSAMERTMLSVAYSLPISQLFIDNGTVTTWVGSCDGMWEPYSLPPPDGVNIIACDKLNSSYGTLWLEVQDPQTRFFNAKLKSVFGPEPASNPPPADYVRDTSVQLVVEIEVEYFGPERYYAAARLWDWNGTWLSRPRKIYSVPLQDTIEFGQVDRQGNAHATDTNACIGPGTHLLHLPIDLLYANVPAAHVPANLPNPPCLPGMFTIDLFDVQRRLR